MEVFRRIMERTLAHERSKAAYKTRKACAKHITQLQGVVVELKDQLTARDCKVASLDKEIEVKKGEIRHLEGEIKSIRISLTEKDKRNSDLQLSLNTLREKHSAQVSMLAATKRQIAVCRSEGEDASQQLWQIIEENGIVNKRILELDMEVHSLEELLNVAKEDVQKQVIYANIFRDSYEKKSREVIEINTREQSLKALVLNLQSELEQWRISNSRTASTVNESISSNYDIDSCNNNEESSQGEQVEGWTGSPLVTSSRNSNIDNSNGDLRARPCTYTPHLNSGTTHTSSPLRRNNALHPAARPPMMSGMVRTRRPRSDLDASSNR